VSAGTVRPSAPPSDAPDRGEREAFDLLICAVYSGVKFCHGGEGFCLGGRALAKFLIPSADSLGVNLFK